MAFKVLIVEDQFIEANNLANMLEAAGYSVCGTAKSVPEAVKIIEKEQPDLALVDIQLKGVLSGIELAGIFRQKNIAFIYVSANSNHETLLKAKATQPFGFIVKPFRERDLIVTLEIAQYRHENGVETALRKEEQFRISLHDIVAMEGTKADKMYRFAAKIQAFLPFDYFAVYSNTGVATGELMSFLRIGFDEYQFIGLDEFPIITKLKPDEINRSRVDEANVEKSFFIGDDYKKMIKGFGLRKVIAEKFMVHSLLVFPLDIPGDTYLNFYFYSRMADAYNSGHIALLDRLSSSLSVAVRNILGPGTQHISGAAQNQHIGNKSKDTVTGFEGIIGKC